MHRNLKLTNLFLERDSDSGAEQVRILDFGTACLTESSGTRRSNDVTRSVAAIPAYWSPEQVAGKPATPMSDVYALGAIAYELLAGHSVFGGSAASILVQRATSTVPALDYFPPNVPIEAKNLVAAMLARDPEQRPGSMLDIARKFVALESSAAN